MNGVVSCAVYYSTWFFSTMCLISFGMSFDDVEPRPSSVQRFGCVLLAVIPGYSAENTFGFARVALQPEGIKHFWETGFWNDFMNPDKSVSSVLLTVTSSDLLTTPLMEHQKRVDCRSCWNGNPKALKQVTTFMDHVRDVPVMPVGKINVMQNGK